jgi:hypothetical protein
MDRFGLFRLQYSMVKLFFTSTFARWRSYVPNGALCGRYHLECEATFANSVYPS